MLLIVDKLIFKKVGILFLFIEIFGSLIVLVWNCEFLLWEGIYLYYC